MLVTSKDMWERSILEHSVASGREHVFEACFNAVRKDVFDKEVSWLGMLMLPKEGAPVATK